MKKTMPLRKNRVRELREANAWSKAELARQAGVVSQTIAKIERGEPVSRNSELKISKALGKKHDEVFPS